VWEAGFKRGGRIRREKQKYTTSHHILKSIKGQEAGPNKTGAGTRVEGYGK